MGDKSTLAKARKELEEMYLGIPDDSVNLTFQDLAQVRQSHNHHHLIAEHKTSINSPPAAAAGGSSSSSSSLTKIPSIDFNQSIEASRRLHNLNNNNNDIPHHYSPHFLPPDHHHINLNHQLHRFPPLGEAASYDHPPSRSHHHQQVDHNLHMGGQHHSVGFSSEMMMSMGASTYSHYNERGGGRRRAGIPHSNICTICSTYIYIFRHRCLVCGRVYCKQCVRIGMGDMSEGRKCIHCLGRRFSQRYIQKAGRVGCCMGYPSAVKQEELKWAEKGPRKSGENRYGQSTIRPRSRSPMTPRSPTSQIHSTGNTPSFVMNSPYSPFSHTTHHMPL